MSFLGFMLLVYPIAELVVGKTPTQLLLVSVVALIGTLAWCGYIVWKWKNPWRVPVIVLLCFSTGASIVFSSSIAQSTDGDSDLSVGTALQTARLEPIDISLTEPDTLSIGLDTPCGLEAPIQRPLPKATICVVYWCKGNVYFENGSEDFDNLQIKLRPRIVNDSSEPIDTRMTKPAAVRLLISDEEAGPRWDPPPLTRSAGDAPRRIKIDGRVMWALPPNVNNDYRGTAAGFADGFASSWVTQLVAPGSSFLETRRNSDGSLLHAGNLVFQVPAVRGRMMQVAGIALLDRTTGQVMSKQWSEDWGKSSDPNSF